MSTSEHSLLQVFQGKMWSGSPRAIARWRPISGNESGQSMTEFALSVTAFVILTIAIVATARAVNVYEALSAAAREGTHYGMTNGPISTSPASVSAIQSYVTGQLAAAGLNPASTTVNVTWPADPLVTNGTDIEVQVSYPFTVPFFSVSITLTGNSRMLIWQW